jgi:hypothetical protein
MPMDTFIQGFFGGVLYPALVLAAMVSFVASVVYLIVIARRGEPCSAALGGGCGSHIDARKVFIPRDRGKPMIFGWVIARLLSSA